MVQIDRAAPHTSADPSVLLPLLTSTSLSIFIIMSVLGRVDLVAYTFFFVVVVAHNLTFGQSQYGPLTDDSFSPSSLLPYLALPLPRPSLLLAAIHAHLSCIF